ncbi:PIN-like domain-containing protein [Streptomyces sp. NPDC002917]|uniref:PIN-like domain-containing protein n=1 Tax=Streptomyces sp. NPDC002917 TaxID=3364671 RepID=UPI0036A478B2
MSGDNSDATTSRGLFDGYEGYRTPTAADYERLMRSGLIVLDTNVLLDLYRMNHRVRADMLTVLDSLQDRLWIPHQVVEEFWRNQQQDGLLGHHEDRASQAKQTLAKARENIRQAINRWAKEVHLSDDAPIRRKLEEGSVGLGSAIEVLSGLIDEQASSDEVPGSADTNRDPVIQGLESLLQGRIGAPMSDADRHAAIATAKSRAAIKQPPGFRDFEEGKPDPAAAGDYLVWVQLMEEAKRRGIDALFVTRDLKEDWWRSSMKGMPRQPRVELVHEMRAITGHQLFMMEPSNLMKQARSLFDLESRVDQQSVTALEQLETTESAGGERWDEASLEALIDLLLETAVVQAQTILDAALNDGFVSRETVYDLGGYDASRMLRGFTRPVKTAARRLQDDGVSTGDPSELLKAVYDNGVVATGFRIPQYTVPILKLLAERVYRESDLDRDADGVDSEE